MPVPSREPFSVGTMRYQILDRALAERTVSDQPYAVITITGSEQQFARIPSSDNQLGVLRIKFDDIQYPVDGMVLFSIENARQVWDFYRKMKAKGMKLLIVNCEYGRCRSAGLAAGISEIEGGRTTWFDRRFDPNAHVRAVMSGPTTIRSKKE